MLEDAEELTDAAVLALWEMHVSMEVVLTHEGGRSLTELHYCAPIPGGSQDRCLMLKEL